MDLAALIKDGQVAWLHASDVPPDLKPIFAKGPVAAKKPSAIGRAPPALASSGVTGTFLSLELTLNCLMCISCWLRFGAMVFSSFGKPRARA